MQHDHSLPDLQYAPPKHAAEKEQALAERLTSGIMKPQTTYIRIQYKIYTSAKWSHMTGKGV